ncbi:MAG TPA: SsrA-binding protein SmpB [bacterium]|nr:SsrA-binding protein SmpB [bacterium]
MSKSASSKHKQKSPGKEVLVADNRKARHEYDVLDRFEAGIVLRGTEVKVLRQGHISLNEAYAKFTGSELWLLGANIPEYSHGNIQNHAPKRRRKLLLKKAELKKLKEQVATKGLTLIPLRVYFGEKGFAKCTIGVCRGRKTHDKRHVLKEKEARREMRDA